MLVPDGIYPDGVEVIDSVEDEHLLTIGVVVAEKLLRKESVDTGEAVAEKLTKEVIDAFIEVDNFTVLDSKGLVEGVSVLPSSENVASADDDDVVLPDDESLGVHELEPDRVDVAETNALLLLVTVPTDERDIPNNDVLASAETEAKEPVADIVPIVDSLATLLVNDDCEEDCDWIEVDETLTHELSVNVIRVEREAK